MKKSLFQLKENPKILNLLMESNSEFDLKKNKKLNVELNIESKYEKDNEKKEAKVLLKIRINDKNNINGDVPFYIEADIVGYFFWNKVESSDVDIFLETNGPSILLSYIRPVISNLITYSGYPPYIIPFLDLRK